MSGSADNSREVHGTRVVRDDQVAVREHAQHLGDRRAPNEIGRRHPGELGTHPRVVGIS